MDGEDDGAPEVTDHRPAWTTRRIVKWAALVALVLAVLYLVLLALGLWVLSSIPIE